MTGTFEKGMILQRVQRIAVRVFGCSESDVTERTVAADVDGWDSLSHTVFLVELEREFNVQFDLSRILDLATVGELVGEIERLAS